MLRTDLVFLGILLAFAVAAFVFRGLLGPLVFAAVLLVTLVQLFRVLFLRGRGGTLRKLWDVLKDVFWGIG